MTVSGVNLGKAAADLEVTVANSPCTVVVDSYVPSQRFGIFCCWYFLLEFVLKDCMTEVLVKMCGITKQLTVRSSYRLLLKEMLSYLENAGLIAAETSMSYS